MESLFTSLFGFLTLLLIIGLIKPTLVLGKIMQTPTRKNVLFIYLLICIVLGIASSIFTESQPLTSKKYTYIEIQHVSNYPNLGTKFTEKDSFTIIASTDSAAYVQAYQKFCNSKKNDLTELIGSSDLTHKAYDFKLLDVNKVDISKSLNFANKIEREKEIVNSILGAEVEKHNNIDLKTVSLDSSTINKYINNFRIDEDEFSESKSKWYKPKSAPKYINSNAFYCYFNVKNGVANNLRLQFQYYAEDWLFINQIIFSIDDQVFTYRPKKMETDHGDGNIWEWFDESVDDELKTILDAIVNSKSTKLKLNGNQYYKVKSLSKEQIDNLKASLELYKAMGGQY